MIKKSLLGLFFSTLLMGAAVAQSGQVQQSGTITPGHAARFVANGVIGDGGTAASGLLTSLGVQASGAGICQNSAAITSAGWQRICLGVTTTGGGFLSVQNNGTATPQPFKLIVNGTTLTPTSYAPPATTGSPACFTGSAGTITNCTSIAGLPISGATITGSTINSTSIGATVPASGNFTGLSINGVPVGTSTDTFWSDAGGGKIQYSGGFIGMNITTPLYQLDIVQPTNSAYGLHIAPASGFSDTGFYAGSRGTSVAEVAGGATNNGTDYVAKSTLASILSLTGGQTVLYGNTGLTAGNTFTPTRRFSITTTGLVGIGPGVPLYQLDIVEPGTSSAVRFGLAGDTGGYLSSIGDTQAFLSGGGALVSGSWTAKATSSSQIGMFAGVIAFGADTGLTPATTFVPTEIMRITPTSRVGVKTTTPLSSVDVVGSLGAAITTITTNTTIDETYFTVLCDTTSAGVQINLPAPSAATRRMYHIKNTGPTFTCNVVGSIDVGGTISVGPAQRITLQSNGTLWYLIQGLL